MKYKSGAGIQQDGAQINIRSPDDNSITRHDNRRTKRFIGHGVRCGQLGPQTEQACARVAPEIIGSTGVDPHDHCIRRQIDPRRADHRHISDQGHGGAECIAGGCTPKFQFLQLGPRIGSTGGITRKYVHRPGSHRPGNIRLGCADNGRVAEHRNGISEPISRAGICSGQFLLTGPAVIIRIAHKHKNGPAAIFKRRSDQSGIAVEGHGRAKIIIHVLVTCGGQLLCLTPLIGRCLVRVATEKKCRTRIGYAVRIVIRHTDQDDVGINRHGGAEIVHGGHVSAGG